MPIWRTLGLIPLPSPALAFRAVTPIDMGNGVQFLPLPIWVGDLNMGAELAWTQLDIMAGRPAFVLCREYEAEALGEPEPTWTGLEPMSRQVYAEELLRLANLAMWLVEPAATLRFRHTLHVRFDAGSPPFLEQWTRRDALYLNREPLVALTPDHFVRTRSVNEALMPLDRTGPLWIAIKSTGASLVMTWYHLRYLLLWIALEALFGPRDGVSVKRRTARRLGVFLRTDATQRDAAIAAAVDDYDERSGIAHGEGGRVPVAQWPAQMERAEDWLREVLLKILATPALVADFSDPARRETYLQGIVQASGIPLGGVAA